MAFPQIVAFLGGGLGTVLASVLLETFVFRRVVKARPELSPWNRELNAVSLVLASMIGGAVAVKLAQSSVFASVALPAKLRGMLSHEAEKKSAWPIAFAAAGVMALLWFLRPMVFYNPLTVGWRGFVMNALGAAAGGSLLVGGKARRMAWPALAVVLVAGFGTVRYDYHRFQLSFRSDKAILQGEMIVPGRRADVVHPAVLLVPDLGCQDRDETLGSNQPLREIAEHLALNGYAVLRYDKRGCGESGGEFTHSGLEDFAQDAAAAGALLAGQRGVDKQRVFAVGHGTGGQAITIAASEQPGLFAGLALLATPANSTSDWLRDQQRYKLTALGASAAEIDARLAAVDEWIEGVRTRRYLNYGDYFGGRGIAEELQAEQRSTPLPPLWLRQAMEHNQMAALAAVPVPTLILSGAADWRVPPTEAEALAGALTAAGRSDWELRQLASVNHHLVTVESMEAGFILEQTDAYTKKRRLIAPPVLEALTNWLKQRE